MKMKLKNFSLAILTGFMLVALAFGVLLGGQKPVSAKADGTLSGEGTADNPYLITSLADLKTFRDDVNDNANDYDGKYLKLTADIDLAGENWTPIGVNGSHNNENSFRGYFDGNNHTISNLTITDETSTEDKLGLFGHIHGDGMKNSLEPSVKDLEIKNVNISSADRASRIGGLVGNPYTCYIKNVHVTGTISGGKWTGGIAGNCYTVFENCSYTGNVTSNNQAGGIAGAGDARVYNCVVVGDITADYWAGGIIGNGQEGASVVGCYMQGDVAAKSNWYRGVGGIAGVAGHGYNGSEYRDNYFNGEVFLEEEKIEAVVMGFVNAESNAAINTVVGDNSWSTEYYSADLEVYVVAELEADSDWEEYVAGAEESKTTGRNNNLVVLESDLQYVKAESTDEVVIKKVPMANLPETTVEQVGTAIVNNATAKIGDAPYVSIDNAIAAVQNGETITLCVDDASASKIAWNGLDVTIDLGGKTWTPVGNNIFTNCNVTFKNGTINLTGVVATGNAIFEFVNGTATLDGVNVIGDGYSSAIGIFYLHPTTMNVNNCTFDLKNDQFDGGVFYANNKDASLNITNSTLTLENTKRGVVHATTVIEDSEVTIKGTVEGGLEHGFNRSALTIKGESVVAISGGSGRGITAENGAICIEDSARVDISDMGEATVEVRGGQTVTIAETALLVVDVPAQGTDGAALPEGVINGDVHSEHVWAEATCIVLKTCTVCGATEGDFAGHDFAEATCTTPKTCKVCQATEGDVLPHAYNDATCHEPKTCPDCGATEGDVKAHVDADKDYVCDDCGDNLAMTGTPAIIWTVVIGAISAGVVLLLIRATKKKRY